MSQVTTPAPEAVLVVPCPRCEKPLIDPNGLGWCKACGFCRSLAEGVQRVERPVSQPNTLTATSAAVTQIPVWLVVTFLGIGAVVGATFAASHFLRLTDFQRALFTTLQIGGGLAFMLIGQFMGLMRIAPEEMTLSFFDAVFPFRLYGMVMKRLPSTQFTLYLGAWGFTAIVAAGVLIGGLGHWLTFLPGQQNNAAKKISRPGF